MYEKLKLTEDLKKASLGLSREEARFLVDAYYQLQDARIRAAGQIRAVLDETPGILSWVQLYVENIEDEIKKALTMYASGHPVCEWAQTVKGIGPVLSAGLVAHIDITKCPTVGHIWSFAGVNPEQEWGKGQKRPYNADLKVLQWKIGESFVRSGGGGIYNDVYKTRKEQEIARNLNGDFADQAKAKLKKFNIGKNTDAYKWYAGRITRKEAERVLKLAAADKVVKPKLVKEGKGQPMLPPAHIHSRAKRYAVKLFMSHWHFVAYFNHYGKRPPKPYILEHGHGHVHEILPPNFDVKSKKAA